MAYRVGVLLPLLIFLSVGCGRKAEETADYDNTEEVERYYADHPEVFRFATLADLPEGLEWEDGSGLPFFADPHAKRGGHMRLRLDRLQSTLRIVGPDANGSLRHPLWNSNSVPLLGAHPWEEGYYPGLARRWAVLNTTPQEIFFELDPDARWSDGLPVTTDDFLFSLYVLRSPYINDPAINRVFSENFAQITQYDDRTFSVTLGKPTPDPLAMAGGLSILFQREFYREFGPDYTDRYHSRFAPVTGPYTLAEEDITRGQRVSFRRLESWWADEKPFYWNRYNPDMLTYVVIRDDFKAFEAFLNGSIDFFSLNSTELWYDRADAASIRDGYIHRSQYYTLLPAGSFGIQMNSMQPLLDDLNVRIGIQHAINYDRVNKDIYRGDRRRIRSFVDGYGAYDHPELRAREYDIQRALAHFAKAGFTGRGTDGILVDESARPLSLTLTVDNSSQDSRVALLLREEAAQAGLNLRIEELDPTASFSKLFEKNHELILSGWTTGFATVPIFEWEIRGEDAGKKKNFNSTNIKDEALDALLEKWDTLQDPEEAYQVSHEVQEKIHEYAAWVPGLTADFTRVGYWRWVKWPNYFHGPKSQSFTGLGVFWIDEDLKEETLEARKNGTVFSPVTGIHDRWKQ